MTTLEVTRKSNIPWNKIDRETLKVLYTDPVSTELTVISNRISAEPPSPESLDGFFKMLVNSMANTLKGTSKFSGTCLTGSSTCWNLPDKVP